MKVLLTYLLICISAITSFAITFQGTVKDVTTNAIIPGRTVYLITDSVSGSPSISVTTVTDGNGDYTFDINLPNNFTGNVYLKTLDLCNNIILEETFDASQTIGIPLIVQDFLIDYFSCSCGAVFSLYIYDSYADLFVVKASLLNNSTNDITSIQCQLNNQAVSDTSFLYDFSNIFIQISFSSLNLSDSNQLTLTVNYNNGCSFSQSINLINIGVPCNAAFDVEYNVYGHYNIVKFSPLFPSPAYSVTWDYGDGNTIQLSYLSNMTNSYTNANPGDVFTVCLNRVNSSQNLTYVTCSYCVDITIPDILCQANFYVLNDTLVANNNLDPSNTYIVNSSSGSINSYLWNFGDGNTSTDPYPTYSYAANGVYNICLTVNGGTNLQPCSNTFCQDINVTGRSGSGGTIVVLSPEMLGVNETATYNQKIEVYPNPSNGQFNVSLNSLENTSGFVQIFDLNGKLLMSFNENFVYGNSTLTYDLSSLKSGNYILKLYSSNFQYNKLISLIKE